MASFTTKTKKWMEEMAYLVEKTEHHNVYSCTKHDLLNCMDHLAINPDAPAYKLLGIQTSSRPCVPARVKKIMSEMVKDKDGVEVPNPVRAKAVKWLLCGGSLVVVGWDDSKPKSRGCRVVEIYLDASGERGVMAKQELDINLKPILKKGVQHEV